MLIALDHYTTSIIAGLEEEILRHVRIVGPTEFHILHRASQEPMSYVVRAVESLIKRDLAHWCEPRPRMMADWMLTSTSRRKRR